MQETIVIRLPEGIRTALDDVTRQEGVEPIQVVNRAIEEYLFFRRLRLLQERMIAKAQAQGIKTEEEVFQVGRNESSHRLVARKN